ncbi:uncharacterized protein LOC128158807 [Crassostrea angulata]|uniref:uncharacterized protein LOC128158202 n=1 Tax=Magallana angulata TaxID=2784310 RepID=UPI0022B1E442|nr:uncharacterized protein LOC128158202 [Crassostrea angulata]XP_052677728.1 uncharacterized protein LOC128158807 [Crassostrea angulata]
MQRISEQLRRLFLRFMRHSWWIYETGVAISIAVPLCLQYLCEEPQLSLTQHALSPVVTDLGFEIEATCRYLEGHFRYRVYKYITIRVTKVIWRLHFERRAPLRYCHLFPLFLEFLTLLIVVVLPIYDIYSCEERPLGELGEILEASLNDLGFVRLRQCTSLSVYDVLRRYVIFTLPRCAIRMFLLWRRRGRHEDGR